MKGLVIKNTGSWYLLKAEDGTQVEAKIKGNFRMKDIRATNPITVGDRVVFDVNAEGQALISTIEPRRNYIIRRASNLSKQSHIIACNIDLSVLVVTLRLPETSTVFIDRFLATAQAYRVPTVLVFNKTDLYNQKDKEYLAGLMRLYEHLDYKCFAVSAIDEESISALKTELKDKIALFSGHSGVGKSTLINTIMGKTIAKTGGISDYHKKGMHTTTFSEMFELPFGGYIIDTPGIKGFGTIDMKTNEISHYFPEIFAKSTECKFYNCTHTHEPQCAVLEAVENGYIAASRYNSYLSILGDVGAEKYR
ncbi:MAG: ribosome small subunit-dependent GTPase A [Prevotellaceae bacterium]|jgi:ribosome biogenesis GTPase|nr:ribosome small subunit-dependent GTPase A [Prevotellaceae bacterium]